MPHVSEVIEQLETIATHIERIAVPLAMLIDERAFGGEPPSAVSFERIDAAVRRTPPPAELADTVRYLDGVLVSSGVLAREQVGSFGLLDSVVRIIRRSAERLPERSGEDARLDAEAAQGAAHAFAFQVVATAWLLRAQLLVVDLALAIGIDPVPLPEDLKGGGDA